MAKKHVDGNNIGPSYIIALGEHDGGGLWTADKYELVTPFAPHNELTDFAHCTH